MSPGFALDPAIWFFFSRTTAVRPAPLARGQECLWHCCDETAEKAHGDSKPRDLRTRPSLHCKLPLVAACGARKRCVKKWHSQPKLQRTSDCMPRPRPGTGGARSQSLACGIVQARNRLCARADDRALRASNKAVWRSVESFCWTDFSSQRADSV